MRNVKLGRVAGGFIAVLATIVVVWGETGGVVHAFRRHGVGDGWAAVFVPPLALYRGIEMFFHHAPPISQQARRSPGVSSDESKSAFNPPRTYTSRGDFGSACWWLHEYPALVEKASKTPGGSLVASYATDNQTGQFAEVGVRVIHGRGACLYFVPPKGSLMRRNLRTGQTEPQDIAVIWDTDLDGVPDGYWSGMKGEPIGDLIGLDDEDFAGGPGSQFLDFWVYGMGFATNHFLHGLDSALPRN